MIEFHGDNAIVNADDVSFTFETVDKPREFEGNRPRESSLDWTEDHYHIGNWRIYPYGDDNNLPKMIKDIVHNNDKAPGILKKRTQLLWGKGPKLYRESIINNEIVREWVDDAEVQEWLDSWDAESYIQKEAVDYNHIEGCLTKLYRGRGGRIGEPSIAKLEHVSIDKGRLASPFEVDTLVPSHAVVTDWNFNKASDLTKFKVYPLFDFLDPFKHKNAILYSNMYSFCSDYYTVPDIYGSLEWLKRGTAIPLILKALSKNSINLKYHVISPDYFWKQKRNDLMEECAKSKKEYKESMLLEYKSQFLKQVGKVLSGAENTGKFWHSVKYLEVDGTRIAEHGWEIKELPQNIKDFVEAQIKISEHASRATSSSLNVHASLTGTGDSGRADSGSEQLYALKNYLITGNDIPEIIVLKAVNYAIKANWPKKKLKLGFYHITPQKEQDVSPNDRLKEQV